MIRAVHRPTKGVRYQAYSRNAMAEKIYIGTYGTKADAAAAIAAHAKTVAPARARAQRAALGRNLRRAEERVARIKAQIAMLDWADVVGRECDRLRKEMHPL